MDAHIYKKIEVIGTSPDSLEGAIRNAVSRASDSLDNLRWFEVTETRGAIENGKVSQWQVGVKIAFTLQDAANADGEKLAKARPPVT